MKDALEYFDIDVSSDKEYSDPECAYYHMSILGFLMNKANMEEPQDISKSLELACMCWRDFIDGIDLIQDPQDISKGYIELSCRMGSEDGLPNYFNALSKLPSTPFETYKIICNEEDEEDDYEDEYGDDYDYDEDGNEYPENNTLSFNRPLNAVLFNNQEDTDNEDEEEIDTISYALGVKDNEVFTSIDVSSLCKTPNRRASYFIGELAHYEQTVEDYFNSQESTGRTSVVVAVSQITMLKYITVESVKMNFATKELTITFRILEHNLTYTRMTIERMLDYLIENNSDFVLYRCLW